MNNKNEFKNAKDFIIKNSHSAFNIIDGKEFEMFYNKIENDIDKLSKNSIQSIEETKEKISILKTLIRSYEILEEKLRKINERINSN